MASSSHQGDAIRQVNRLFQVGAVGLLTDGQLLERFTTRRGDSAESAFESLVARHGPMVVRVCRGLLRDPHDVDDAFQATFLVLVKKASSIGERELLGPWLYGVAHRTALKARSLAAKRKKREGTRNLDDPPGETADGPWLDLRPVLHEELAKLPDKYRKPIVLCHLQGLTHLEAAQELAWPVGTVSVRLSRARKLLKDRLTRRGLTATATLWGAGLMGDSAMGSVPSTLIHATVKAALELVSGKSIAAAAGTISAGATLLSKRTITIMTMSRWMWGTLPLVLGVGALGGVVATQQVMIQKMEHQARANAEAQALASRSQPLRAPDPVVPVGPDMRVPTPVPTSGRSPFDVDGQNLVSQPPAKTPEAPIQVEENEPPIEVEPPVVIRNGLVELDPPPGYFDIPASNQGDGTDPPLIKTGQILQVEVLETLPGRPITGDRVVRPDGTISLGFYGDLQVAGLNRLQIKVKLIEHLRKFLNDETLGLVVVPERNGPHKAARPQDSNRVSIDESINYYPAEWAGRPAESKPINTLPDLLKGPPANQAPASNDRRIADLESKLEMMLKELEELRARPEPARPPETPVSPPAAKPG